MAEVLSAEAAKAIPAALRKMLRTQCAGEWDRVTRDDDGSYTVHNNAARAAGQATLHLVKPPPVAPPVAPPPPPAPRRAPVAAPRPVQTPPAPRPRSAEALALNTMLQARRAEQIQPGLHVVSAPVQAKPPTEQWSFSPQEVDWASFADLEATAGKLRDRLQAGLPAEIPFSYHPDVLAMQGMDFDLVEAALRHPERVEVRPETAKKKYPILAFWRGDVVTILGMRTPTHPMIIAAYAVSRLDPELGRRPTGGGGGGGARKQEGLPGTTSALMRGLARLGVTVQQESPEARTAEVVYKGQRLGKVTVGHAPRSQVESDWQRILRKVTAIDARS